VRLHTLTFDAEKKWKGAKTRKINLVANDLDICRAFELREDEKYLLYVQKDSYAAAECAPSVEFSSEAARDRLKYLDGFRFRLKSHLWIF